jgi:uncharacterized protein
MKTSLSHLPGYKQEQILKITEVIKEVVASEKIILFGSYAKGTWVEDEYIENGIRYSYISDYDFLIVTKNNEEKEYLLNDKIVNRSRHITNVAVNCLIHDMDYINEGLSIGQYFFTDIINEGVLLYDNDQLQFAKPKQLAAEEQKEIAQRYFDQWFNRAKIFLRIAIDCLENNELKIGVFQLHQATENFYNTVLLVFTGYKPKTHSLEKLRQYAKPYSKELLEIFPERSGDKMESHLFDLLKRGYIDARYKNDYIITEEELSALIGKVRKMQETVEGICSKKIGSLVNGKG